MVTSIRQLRISTKEILSAVERGETVYITNRGKTCAQITAVKEKKGDLKHVPAFGMLKDREDMKNPSEYVRKIRGKSSDMKKHPAFGMLKDDPQTANVPAYIRKMRKGRYAL
jgi:prevent-host-death family protein